MTLVKLFKRTVKVHVLNMGLVEEFCSVSLKGEFFLKFVPFNNGKKKVHNDTQPEQ